MKKGDLLFELDKAPFQAAVDQYAAQLESAKADVKRLQAGVGDPVEVAFMSRPGKVDTGKVIRIANYTGEGQLAAQGDVPVVANIRSKGFFSAIVQLDDEALAESLGLGEAGAAAIYTEKGGSLHFLSRLYIRMISFLFFLS